MVLSLTPSYHKELFRSSFVSVLVGQQCEIIKKNLEKYRVRAEQVIALRNTQSDLDKVVAPGTPGKLPRSASKAQKVLATDHTVEILGETKSCRDATDATVIILTTLAAEDSTFLDRCSRHPEFRGKKRRYIARRIEDLNRDRPDLSEQYHAKLPGGWFIGTNESNERKEKLIKAAAEVAGFCAVVRF